MFFSAWNTCYCRLPVNACLERFHKSLLAPFSQLSDKRCKVTSLVACMSFRMLDNMIAHFDNARVRWGSGVFCGNFYESLLSAVLLFILMHCKRRCVAIVLLDFGYISFHILEGLVQQSKGVKHGIFLKTRTCCDKDVLMPQRRCS